jgi:hypothetical protein
MQSGFNFDNVTLFGSKSQASRARLNSSMDTVPIRWKQREPDPA